jgi:Nucleotide modification associated domain 1
MEKETELTSDVILKITEQTPFEKAVSEKYIEAENLLLRKHRDYGPKNISASPGGAINGLRVRIHDKLARINNLYDNGATPENESLRDSFIDMANYAIIALLVLDDEWDK